MRLIDADAYQEMAYQRNFDGLMSEEALFNINLILDKQPTIEAQEQKHGRWIAHSRTDLGELQNNTIECSVCGISFPLLHMSRRSFCPNCGAKME